mgnify:FL=1
MSRTYANKTTAAIGEYFQSAQLRLKDGKNTKDVFDSVCHDNSVQTPKVLDTLLGKLGGFEQDVFDSVVHGMNVYEKAHGCEAPADVIEQALHNAVASQMTLGELNIRLDSATESHIDAYSLQPNRAIVSIMSAMAEAIPFAGYVPADIGSNEAKSLILHNRAKSNWGGYAANGAIDGTFNGEPYMMPNRLITLTTSNQTAYTGTARAQYQAGSRLVVDGASAGLKLMAGRTQILVNGFVVAKDMRGSSLGGTTAVSGATVIGVTEHTITGTVNNDTGAIALTFSPALPNNTSVVAEVIADFERDPDTIPSFGFEVESFSYYAAGHRAMTELTMDSQSQVRNEMNLDPASNSLFSLRTQLTNEQHYHALQLGYLISGNNSLTHDFNLAAQFAAKSISDIFADVEQTLFVLDQNMINDTLGNGITHLYVGRLLGGVIAALPRTIFEPSGLPSRAGIYRLGRLFGKYEVYYTPKVLVENLAAGTATMLCASRSADVGRSPIIMGDAVAPTFIPLATNSNLVMKQAFYQRSFLQLNKHLASSKGFARVDFINLPNH